MGKRGFKTGTKLTHYTEENYQEILDDISSGKTLGQACQKTHLPNRAAVYRRTQANPEFKERYDEAQRLRVKVLEDQIQEIADDISRDDESPAAVYRARLKIDARKWLLAIHNPERYAQYNRQQIKHEGMGALPQPVINISYAGVDPDAAKDGSTDQSSVTPEAEGSVTEHGH